MIFKDTHVPDVYIIEPERYKDERGFFARVFSEKEFRSHGINDRFVESNKSFNNKAGTLRGMHYQAIPYGQGKLVSCARGAIFDVGVDLRPGSTTFMKWIGVELTAENDLMLFLPPDFAHGYLTLKDETEVIYHVTSDYFPSSARGFRWDDPAFQITWPNLETLIINERDRNYPDFT
jgi:dTDP-4-dehydrorhamnose 3,5-epimerase